MNHSGIRETDQYSGIIEKHKFLLPKNVELKSVSYIPPSLSSEIMISLLLGYACLHVLSKVPGLHRKALGR